MSSSSYIVLLYLSCMLPCVFSDYLEGEFNEKEQEEMVEAHNYFRSNEKAANMIKLKWSKFLAKEAYNWVQKCQYEHNHPDTPFPSVGQNIYFLKPYKRLPAKSMVQKWFDEKKYYNFDDQSCRKECGHYTQVVWSDTALVGCASKNCSMIPQLKKDGFLLLCNYAPGGNNPDTDPYEPGNACSMCEESAPCENGLCSVDYTY